MTCGPTGNGVQPSEMFAFSRHDGGYQRGMQNAAVLWSAPWRAWWALAAEATAYGAKR
jgi:hypothetical protein